MASASKYRNHFFKKERLQNMVNAALVLFYTVVLTILFSFYLLFSPRTINYTTNFIQEFNQTTVFTQPYKNDSRNCNLFKGQWIPDKRGSLYTNFSCTTIPYKRNCFRHGREDTDFLEWRWKPDQCELPRFSPKTFLSVVQGKTMAFIGDSIARNQMESLLCLLSTIETPKEVDKDAEDLYRTWEFPKHNFTLMALWSQFLVTATERVFNGSATGGFDLQLDKVDQNWSEKLHLMDYVIFSDAHWFFRQNYLYEGRNLIGCVYCQAPNVTDLGPSLAIQRAFQAAFKQINECNNCKKVFTCFEDIFTFSFREWHVEHGRCMQQNSTNRERRCCREGIGLGIQENSSGTN
ncbi:Protein ALTERED XYLOGLUCAN 4-like [Abeliophyllum distichum]|uniref:Protein ALTERED XYLOGLUCAN 4-like n=1 Tax=Abeliophyllum distichum TaxID=126358 RepID=A0ABD1SJU7_9LAMI